MTLFNYLKKTKKTSSFHQCKHQLGWKHCKYCPSLSFIKSQLDKETILLVCFTKTLSNFIDSIASITSFRIFKRAL